MLVSAVALPMKVSNIDQPYTPLIHPVINGVVTGSLCVQIFTLFSIGLVQP